MKTVYYPTEYTPIHEVRDWSKVRSILKSALRGDQIPAIIVDGVKGNGNCLNGTHRLAARNILSMLGKDKELIPVKFLSEIETTEEMIEAIENQDFEALQEILDK